MKLSEIVKQYREEHGLSQRDFAKHCGLSNVAVSNLERELNSYKNPYTPSFETVAKVANGMGMSVHELFMQIDDVEVYVSPADEIRDELKDNLELRMLLSTASDLNKSQLKMLTEIAKQFRGN